ncbi:hypothetical protein CTEN210_07063 [Chaetoceros tenuissimus]|uniref:Uncharacterized protein n=1 Tax=Chaetoceros tenuissimus TaxID=426638 RepID=A0AAD3CR81_9STRA|nr:hypothetical protein CTEN210_07063 [Chaetoceros tenuissimus]
MIKSYKKKDPPPNRVKPVPRSVIRQIAQIAFSGNSFNQHATADMIIIAFFFLLRPGEYSYSNTDSDPFLLADVQFWIGHQNGVRGEVIGLSCSGELYLCPVKALARRVIHLKQHNAAPNTPLCTYFCQERQRLVHVCPSDITNTLRTNVAALGPPLVSFHPMLAHAACELLVQMLCCAQMSILMSSVFLAAGDLMKCYDTFICKILNLCSNSVSAC